MKTEWPLWWCISKDAQDLLKDYQLRVYKYELRTPLDADIESLEEIARIMKWPPRHQKRVV